MTSQWQPSAVGYLALPIREMSRCHHFADLPSLTQELRSTISSDWHQMPWLLRRALDRRLKSGGLWLDLFVLAVCVGPALASGLLALALMLNSSSQATGVWRFAASAATLLSGGATAVGLSAAARYLCWRRQASDRATRRLFALVHVDTRAATYVHALLDGNESPRGVDCAICDFIARTPDSALAAHGNLGASVWALWDWHLGISYTDATMHTAGSVDAGKGTIRANL